MSEILLKRMIFYLISIKTFKTQRTFNFNPGGPETLVSKPSGYQ